MELREILLSFQTGFSLVNAAVACAILESISGLEPSSVITDPGTWASDSLKLLSIYFDLCVDATGVVCHQLGLLGFDFHAVVGQRAGPLDLYGKEDVSSLHEFPSNG